MTEESCYASARQRKEAKIFGYDDDIKKGDEYHNQHEYVKEAIIHRKVQENLREKHGIKNIDQDDWEAYYKNCGIIHSGRFATDAEEYGLNLNFNQMYILDPHGYRGGPGYVPRQTAIDQINKIKENEKTNTSVSNSNLQSGGSINYDLYEASKQMSLSEMLYLLQ
jgi:hypothetical protein